MDRKQDVFRLKCAHNLYTSKIKLTINCGAGGMMVHPCRQWPPLPVKQIVVPPTVIARAL